MSRIEEEKDRRIIEEQAATLDTIKRSSFAEKVDILL